MRNAQFQYVFYLKKKYWKLQNSEVTRAHCVWNFLRFLPFSGCVTMRDDNSVDELWISVGTIQLHKDSCRETATGFGRHVGLGVFSAAFQKSLGYIFLTNPKFSKSPSCKVLCCETCCNVHSSIQSCCPCSVEPTN